MTNKIRHPEKVNKPINPIKKKPDWIRSKLTNSKEFFLTKTIVNQNNLVTVCQEANCPNITECWSKRHATFMIMGHAKTIFFSACSVAAGSVSQRKSAPLPRLMRTPHVGNSFVGADVGNADGSIDGI